MDKEVESYLTKDIERQSYRYLEDKYGNRDTASLLNVWILGLKWTEEDRNVKSKVTVEEMLIAEKMSTTTIATTTQTAEGEAGLQEVLDPKPYPRDGGETLTTS